MPRFNCVCIDGSDHSIETMQWYLSNYHRPDDTIGLLHALQIPSLRSMGIVAGGSIAMETKAHENIRKMKDAANQVMQKFAAVCKENNVTYKLLLCEHESESCGEMICKTAKENNADVVVLGQRGLSEFSRSLLGSTSDYVLHNSSIPVVVIPPKLA